MVCLSVMIFLWKSQHMMNIPEIEGEKVILRSIDINEKKL